MSERHFRQFADGISDVMWLADLSTGRLLFVNAAFEQLWGAPAAMLEADPGLWNRQVLAEDRFHLSEPFFIEPTSGADPAGRVRDYRIEAADGSVRWINDRRFLLKNEKGQTVRVGGIAEDVTARKQAEIEGARLLERERAARADAEAAALAKDQFLSVVSHELRSPLNAIRGWAYVLRQVGGMTPVQERALNAIDRNTQAQARLVDDLLDSQRILLGTFTLETHRAMLSALIDEAVEESKLAAESKQIVLEVSHDASINMVAVDVRRMRQAISKLVSNGVKFTPEQGRVKVGSRRAGGGIEIEVSDTGIGIEASHLPSVFDRFRQADSSNTRKQGGLGLGLSLARQLVELHGGRIAARSAGEGQGATVTIWLPEKPDEDPEPEPGDDPKADEEHPLAGRKIMVVEDDVDSREMLEVILRGTHAELVSFDSARRAYEYLASLPADQRPDALVSDIAMPDEDGYSFIKRVRSLASGSTGPRMLALALTAFSRDEDRPRSMRAGFDLHIGKPIDAALLVETLRSALPPLRRASPSTQR